jgi:hypothetical protein
MLHAHNEARTSARTGRGEEAALLQWHPHHVALRAAVGVNSCASHTAQLDRGAAGRHAPQSRYTVRALGTCRELQHTWRVLLLHHHRPTGGACCCMSGRTAALLLRYVRAATHTSMAAGGSVAARSILLRLDRRASSQRRRDGSAVRGSVAGRRTPCSTSGPHQRAGGRAAGTKAKSASVWLAGHAQRTTYVRVIPPPSGVRGGAGRRAAAAAGSTRTRSSRPASRLSLPPAPARGPP